MIKHVVMWNLADKENADKNASHIKEILQNLVGVVPGLISAQVNRGYAGFDVVLISEFESNEALEAYQTHPAHLEVKNFVHSVISERAFCDFEV